jgi:hypothetical protein
MQKQWDTVPELNAITRELAKEASRLDNKEELKLTIGGVIHHQTRIVAGKENPGKASSTDIAKGTTIKSVTKGITDTNTNTVHYVDGQMVTRSYQDAVRENKDIALADKNLIRAFKKDYYASKVALGKKKEIAEREELKGNMDKVASEKALHEAKVKAEKDAEKRRKKEEWEARVAAKKAIKDAADADAKKEREYAENVRVKEKAMAEAKKLEDIARRREKVLSARMAKRSLSEHVAVSKQADKVVAEKELEREMQFRKEQKLGKNVKGQCWRNLMKLNEETSLLDLPFG